MVLSCETMSCDVSRTGLVPLTRTRDGIIEPSGAPTAILAVIPAQSGVPRLGPAGAEIAAGGNARRSRAAPVVRGAAIEHEF